MTQIRVSKLTIIGSDNGLSPGRRQANIWTNAGILLIGPFQTNFSEIVIEIYSFLFKKKHLKMSSGKWRPFCLGLNGLSHGLFVQYENILWCKWPNIVAISGCRESTLDQIWYHCNQTLVVTICFGPLNMRETNLVIEVPSDAQHLMVWDISRHSNDRVYTALGDLKIRPF